MEEDPKGKKEKNRRGDSEKELHSNRLTDLGLVSKQLQLRDTEQERSDQLINKETHSKKVCAEIKGQGATAVHASKLRPNAATPVKNDGEIDSTMGLGDKTSFKTKSVQADLRVKLVSELRLACSADLEILFSFINRSMPLEEKDKQAVKTSLKALESEKISHFHSSLTNFSFGLVNLESLLELLLDLTKTDNAILLHASLRVLHVLLEHVSFRDNITDEEAQPSLDTLFKWMNHIASERTERDVKLEAVSIMNIIVMRTDAYTEREIFTSNEVFKSITLLLRKEAGIHVRKEAVRLVYLLLNCPTLYDRFDSLYEKKESSSSGDDSKGDLSASEEFGGIFEGLADCLTSPGKTSEDLELCQSVIMILALVASSGNSGYKLLSSHKLPQDTNFLLLLIRLLVAEIDSESTESHPNAEVSKARTLLMRDILILLNSLVVSGSSSSSTIIRKLIAKNRDMASLTVDAATRLSNMLERESEITGLARSFKERILTVDDSL